MKVNIVDWSFFHVANQPKLTTLHDTMAAILECGQEAALTIGSASLDTAVNCKAH